MDLVPFTRRTTNEARRQGVPPAATAAALGEEVDPTVERREEEGEELETSALLEEQVSVSQIAYKMKGCIHSIVYVLGWWF